MHVKTTPHERAPRPPTHLVARLRMLVVDGVLPSDQPETITRVAAMLRVDESMAWSTLMELGRDGFLERVGEDSVRVRTLAEMPDDEILEIRRLVEPSAVRAAAEHARVADLIALRQLADQVESALARQEYGEYRHADNEFFAALISLHPNAELARLCTELRHRTPDEGFRVAVEWGMLSDMLHSHRQAVDLIEDGDFAALEVLSLTGIDRLHFVGAPRMDAPYLVGPPIALDPHVDEEFLEAMDA